MNKTSIETDVVVVGSGAGALTAAITACDEGAEVLVVEKTDQIGGTSAMSGGVLWLPNSPLISGAGGEDSAEQAREYMRAVINTPELEQHIDTFIDTIPAMVDYLHSRTPLRLDVLAQFPDMYPGTPGFKMHRCHEARAFH
ncbi:MAG TPA: FAD-dependent oxidoreductase, partial [Spongiibacteraceae bacterium]|nr:FAD-dependent oxidoreductase [Spongiibacteraceae bacterium]